MLMLNGLGFFVMFKLLNLSGSMSMLIIQAMHECLHRQDLRVIKGVWGKNERPAAFNDNECDEFCSSECFAVFVVPIS